MVLVVVVMLLLRKFFFLQNENISNVTNHLLSFVLVPVSMLVALLVCVVCLMS